MANKFGLVLVLFGIFAVAEVFAIEEEPLQTDEGMTMMRIDAGGLWPPGVEDIEGAPDQYRHHGHNKLGKEKSKEFREQMRTMETAEERKEFRRQHEQSRAEWREQFAAGRRDGNHGNRNGSEKERKERRNQRRHGAKLNRVGPKPHGKRQEYYKKWQKQDPQQRPADKLMERVEPAVERAQDWQQRVVDAAQEHQLEVRNMVDQSNVMAIGRGRRAIEEPQVQPTRPMPERPGPNGNRRKGGRKNKHDKEEKIKRRQYKQERGEALQSALEEMGVTLEEYKQMDKEEKSLIRDAVEQQLPERPPMKKQKEKKNKQKAERKGLRGDLDFRQQLKAIKNDDTLSRQEKRAQKDQLKEEFKLKIAMEAEAAATPQQIDTRSSAHV